MVYILPSIYHVIVEHSLVSVEGRGMIFWSGQTQDIMCKVPHQWIARQVRSVSVHCDGGGVSCSVSAAWHSCDGVGGHVLCLQHGIPVMGWGSCPVSAAWHSCDGVGGHVLCLRHGIPVTGWGVMSCVCSMAFLWRGWGVMFCVCGMAFLWRGGGSCPVSVAWHSCDGVGGHVLCLRHGIPVWQHIGQSITATSWHRGSETSDV